LREDHSKAQWLKPKGSLKSPSPQSREQKMTERWISQSQELLKALQELASRKEEDRLELVNAMVFALNAIDRSIHGWRSWIQNLQLMSKFSEDELREMKKGLTEKAEEFIKYDTEVTVQHKEKIPRIVVVRRPGEEAGPDRGIYA